MATIDQNLSSLRELLGAPLLDSARYAAHPLRLAIDAVFRHHRAGRLDVRDLENAKISLLVANLRQIERHSPALLGVLKRQLIVSDTHTYYGARLEVSVSASLIRSGQAFAKTESPDFTIDTGAASVFIECTSVHLSRHRATADDLHMKIATAVRTKAAMPYCNDRTAVFVDATNLHFHTTSIQPESPFGIDRQRLRSALPNSALGAVLVWTYLGNPRTNSYQWKYSRIDTPSADQSLVAFLDACYPVGRDYTPGATFLPTV